MVIALEWSLRDGEIIYPDRQPMLFAGLMCYRVCPVVVKLFRCLRRARAIYSNDCTRPAAKPAMH
jgi:hypothetical protein